MLASSMRLLSPDQYQPQAAALYESVAARLRDILPKARIEHVGASSIPGAISKGDVDICAIVSSDTFESCLDKLLVLGYQIKTDTLRTHQLCMLVPTESAEEHAIQLVEAGSKFEFFVSFRDALRNAPDLVRRYNEVKQWAASFDADEYRKAKGAFITEVLTAAGK